MQTAVDKIKPICEAEGGEYDSTTSVQVFKLRHIDNIRRFMESQFNIRMEDSSKNSEAENRMKYRGSGCWSKYRNKDGSLTVSVDVGCYCSHDCCGHMCGLRHTFQLIDTNLVVITNTSYNY